MNSDKSIEEVWQWKEKVYEEVKGLSIRGLQEFLEKKTEDFQRSNNFKLQVFKPLAKTAG